MMTRMIHTLAAVASVAAALASTAPAQAALDPAEAQYRAIFKEMVETDTSVESGSCTALTEKIAARMKAAGYPEANLHLFVPERSPKAGALVAVYPGRDPTLKAVLLLGHIDVVNARRADWTRDPYTLIEEGGYFYARGTADMKAQDAIYVDSLLRYHAAKYKPLRTIKMALTCGEEGGFLNGARWLVDNQRDLIDAAFALNEGGYGETDAQGNRTNQNIQAAQKVVMGFTFATINAGGHSSVPRPDNAIYSLSRALDKLSRYEFPVQFIEANRGYFTKMANIVGGENGAAMATIVAHPDDVQANAILNRSPIWHSMLRTTCVATTMTAGHAANALPQNASAMVNCRVIPGVAPADILATLIKVVDDPDVTVTPGRTSYSPSAPAPLTPRMMAPLQAMSQKIWPGVPVVPNMATGATDAVTLNAAGIPTYGVTGLFRDPDGNGAHGLNERIRIRSVLEGRRFLHGLIEAYADQKD